MDEDGSYDPDILLMLSRTDVYNAVLEAQELERERAERANQKRRHILLVDDLFGALPKFGEHIRENLTGNQVPQSVVNELYAAGVLPRMSQKPKQGREVAEAAAQAGAKRQRRMDDDESVAEPPKRRSRKEDDEDYVDEDED